MPTKTKAKKTKTSKTKATTSNQEITHSEVTKLTATQAPKRSRKVTVVLAVAILILVVFFGYKFLVVAWVDNTPITRIQLYQKLESQYGKTTTDELITEALIQSEANRRKITVSSQDVDAEIKKLEAQQGGADKLAQALQLQGISMDQLRKELMFNLTIEKMFGENVSVTDEEVNQYMDANKDQFTQAGDDVKAQLKQQLRLQKIGQAFNTWLTEAKKSDRIKQTN